MSISNKNIVRCYEFHCNRTKVYKLGSDYYCAFHYNRMLESYRNNYLNGYPEWTEEKVKKMNFTKSQEGYILHEPNLIA